MKKTLVKTLTAESSELYTVVEGRRCLLAQVKPVFKIYETEKPIPATQAHGCRIKSAYFSLILCPGEDTTREVDEAFLRRVARFELTADVWRQDGVFERLQIDEIIPQSIDPCGDWLFECTNYALTQKLLAL